MNTKLDWRLTPVADVPTSIRQGCLQLLQSHFDGVDETAFARDWQEKSHVAYLVVPSTSNEEANVRAFSTMVTKQVLCGGKTHRIIFSGDTVVDHAYRRGFGLSHCFGRYVLRELNQGHQPLWYLLLSKGCGTYRGMSFAFKHFTPSPIYEGEMEKVVAKQFLAEKYPGRRIVRDFILTADAEAQRLRCGSPDLDTSLDMVGQFFRELNPGYSRGDELICTARVSPENFTTRFERILRGVRHETV